jgi:hypothetical protein
MMQPKKVPMQGGVQNHLGKQKMVTVPKKWQSAKDHPKTELAYITNAEKNLLLKKDLHNSLNGSVNRGPGGIMSLNGYGSKDSSQNVSGAAASAAETNSSNARDRAEVRAAFAPAGPSLPPGVTPKGAQDFRDAFINAGAGQRVNPGFFDSRTFLSPAEIARAKVYRNDPTNRFAKKSYRNTGQSGIMNFIKSGGFFGNLVRSLGQKYGLGKGYDDTSTSISEGFNNNLGLGGINNATYDFDPNAKINQNVDTTGSSRFSNQSLGNINEVKPVQTFEDKYTGGSIPFNPARTLGYGTGIEELISDNIITSDSNNLATEFQDMAVNIGNYSQNAVSNQLYGEDYDVLDPFTQQQIDNLIEQVGTKSTGELAGNDT